MLPRLNKILLIAGLLFMAGIMNAQTTGGFFKKRAVDSVKLESDSLFYYKKGNRFYTGFETGGAGGNPITSITKSGTDITVTLTDLSTFVFSVADNDNDPTNEIQVVQGGTGITVTGDGSSGDPYVVDANVSTDLNIGANDLTVPTNQDRRLRVPADGTFSIYDWENNGDDIMLFDPQVNGGIYAKDKFYFQDEIDAGSQRIQNVGAPVQDNDAVRKIDLDNLSVNDADADPTNEIELPSNALDGQIMEFDDVNGWQNVFRFDAVDDADNDPNNEIQDATQVNLSPTIDFNDDLTDETTVQSALQVIHDENDDLLQAVETHIDDDDDLSPTNEIELPATAIDGQVLTFDDTNGWQAENAASGADNWGAQVVVSDASLTGDGTTGNALSVDNSQITITESQISDLSHTVDTDDQQLSYNAATDEISITDGNTIDITEVDTVLDEATVDAYANNNGYLTSEVDGSTTNELNAAIVVNNGQIQLTDAGGTLNANLISSQAGNTIVQGSDGKLFSAAGSGESTTVTDGTTIDFTLTGSDITAEIVTGSIDETKLDASTNASLDLADSALQSETNDLTSSVTWDNVPDANITQSSVTQHQGALTITESQISDLNHTVDTKLTQEEVEGFAGAMVTGNTETLIGVTYDDVGGKLDFVVEDDLSLYDNTTSNFSTGAHTTNTNLATENLTQDAEARTYTIPSTQSLTFQNHSSNPIFKMNNDGSVGIGISAPDVLTHIYGGSAGTVTSATNTQLTVENNGDAFINLLTPSANASGILFGNPTSNEEASIKYNVGNDNRLDINAEILRDSSKESQRFMPTTSPLYFNLGGNAIASVRKELGKITLAENATEDVASNTTIHIRINRPSTTSINKLYLRVHGYSDSGPHGSNTSKLIDFTARYNHDGANRSMKLINHSHADFTINKYNPGSGHVVIKIERTDGLKWGKTELFVEQMAGDNVSNGEYIYEVVLNDGTNLT